MNNLSVNEINRELEFQKKDFPELHQSAEEDNIVFFLGAGVSKMYGCPIWNEMGKKFAEELLNSKLISNAEKYVLSEEAELDPRKVISICYSICKKKKNLSVYENIIKKICNDLDSQIMNEVYNKIFSLNPKAYLTTNIDLGIKLFSTSCLNYYQRIYNCTSPSDIKTIKEINFQVFKDGNIIYLHGNCENIYDAILPVEKYLEYYTDKGGFLKNLFLNIKGFIIFIGYGLKEWDIIEKIYKIKKEQDSKIWNALLLTPIFSFEITKFNLEKSYYESFGIKPVAYIIDDKGYKELYRVLDNLRKAIDKIRPQPYDIFKEIEGM